MTIPLALTLLVLGAVLALAAVLVVRGRRRQRGSRNTALEADPSGVGIVSAVFLDADDGEYLIELVSAPPPVGVPVPGPVASRLGSALAQNVGIQDVVPHATVSQTYRLVKAPPGGLTRVAGRADRVRGFGVQGNRISGHAEFKKVRPGGTVSPALVLTVASAALGAYWQQQMHSTLLGIQQSLQSLQRRLDHELDARLEVAEQTLAEHEAALPSGRYEPPASVTDGMQAYRVQRDELMETLARLEKLSEDKLSHGAYVKKVIEGGASPLEQQLYRGLRGFAVEARVLHLKRIGGLTESQAYRDELERQRRGLEEDLSLLQTVAQTARAIDSSSAHDRFRVEIPQRRAERHNLERQQAEARRANLADLELVTDQLLTLGNRPALESSTIDVFVTLSGDGEATAVMVDASEEDGSADAH